MDLLIGFNFFILSWTNLICYIRKILNIIFIFGVYYLIQYLVTLICEEVNPLHIVVRNDRMATISLSRNDNYHYLKYLTISLQSAVVMISSPNPKVDWILPKFGFYYIFPYLLLITSVFYLIIEKTVW